MFFRLVVQWCRTFYYNHALGVIHGWPIPYHIQGLTYPSKLLWSSTDGHSTPWYPWITKLLWPSRDHPRITMHQMDTAPLAEFIIYDDGCHRRRWYGAAMSIHEWSLHGCMATVTWLATDTLPEGMGVLCPSIYACLFSNFGHPWKPMHGIPTAPLDHPARWPQTCNGVASGNETHHSIIII